VINSGTMIYELFYTMNLQADEFATVDLSPEKSSVNKGTKRPITSPRGGEKERMHGNSIPHSYGFP
jgi:hypothetical protein